MATPATAQDEAIAEITISPIVADGISKYSDLARGVFLDYQVVNHYEKDMHRYMMPIASPNGFQGNSVAFVQLAAPTLLLVCQWTASRYNQMPPIPKAESADSDWVLLDDHPELVMINMTIDGNSPLYRISGVYTYGHKKPNALTIKDVAYPLPPWLMDAFDRTVTPNDTSDNIIMPPIDIGLTSSATGGS